MTKVDNIPPDIWADTVSIIERTRTQIYFTKIDLDALFAVYNKYLTVEPMRQDCKYCVSQVVSRLRSYVTEYNEHNKRKLEEP